MKKKENHNGPNARSDYSDAATKPRDDLAVLGVANEFPKAREH
jgi:hypothetical protein